jgi:hypothetical protein
VHPLLRPPRGRLEPACAKACPTDSIQFGPYDELVEVAGRRVVELHGRGREDAYLYGASEDDVAGGLGAFFLLTEPPETYGLPEMADSPRRRTSSPRRSPGPAPGSRRGRRSPRRSSSAPAAADKERRGCAGDRRHVVGRGRRRARPLRRRAARGGPRERRRGERRFATREADAGGSGGEERDMTPALGTPGEAGGWERAVEGAPVALHVGEWRDGRWSYLYGDDTQYAPVSESGTDPFALRGERDAEGEVRGPMIHAPVWTWQVPLYFWFGGMSAGASFVGLACDLAGDEKSARIARGVALAAVLPAPPLLIADLGRPARFLNMLRIFKPRSPMSTGSWALMAFSSALAAAVGADLLGRRREARAINAGAAVVGGYFGSYTGILLASTAVPVWARSRLFLGPIFVCTGAATGAAACRLVLIAAGLPDGHPTRTALGRIETGAMGMELLLSEVNERRLGPLARGLEEGTPGKQFKAAKWLVVRGW